MSEYIYGGEAIIDGAAKGETKLVRREQIVRCRDCKFYGYGKYATHCYRFVHKVEPDGFCAWGERSEP